MNQDGNRKTGYAFQRIAREMRGWIQEHPSDPVPSIVEWAKRFQVSYGTALRATALLKWEGLLIVEKGRAPRIAGSSTPVLESRLSIRDRAATFILRSIESGVFPPGRVLPKLAYLSSKTHCSRGTLLGALKCLEQKNRIHRKDRKFIAGPRSLVSASRSTVDVIGIISLRPDVWIRISDRWTLPFGDAFVREAMSLRTVLIPASLPLHSETRSVPELIRIIGDQIGRYGNRWIGSLLLDEFPDISELSHLMDMLTKGNRRVIHFARRPEFLLSGSQVSRYAACRHSSRAHTMAACTLLKENGHCVAGFHSLNRQPWAQERESLLREYSTSSSNGGLRIETYVTALQRLRGEGADNLTSRFIRMAEDGRNVCGKVIRGIAQSLAHGFSRATGETIAGRLVHMLFSMPSEFAYSADNWSSRELADAFDGRLSVNYCTEMSHRLPLLLLPDITAMIVTRDQAIGGDLKALNLAGLHCPDDISLVSFDNDPRYRNLPVTTIDPGLGDLGYRAFHYLSRVFAVRPDRHGIIYGTPGVVDRGSVRRLR